MPGGAEGHVHEGRVLLGIPGHVVLPETLIEVSLCRHDSMALLTYGYGKGFHHCCLLLRLCCDLLALLDHDSRWSGRALLERRRGLITISRFLNAAVLAVSRQEILWVQPRGLRLHSPTRGRTVCAEPRQRVVRSVEASFHTIRPNRWPVELECAYVSFCYEIKLERSGVS